MKRFFLVFISLNFLFLNLSLANTNIGTASSDQIILESKKMCKNIGYKVDTEKFTDCVLKLTIANTKKINKKQKLNNTSNSNSEYVFTGNATFGTPKKTGSQKKHEKKVARYMSFPDQELCVSYINNYGMFKKAKQAARAEAVRKRGLDCNQYRDIAFYDKQRRDAEFADATKELFDGLADAEIEKQKAIQKNYRSLQESSVTCKSRKSGSYIRTTCN